MHDKGVVFLTYSEEVQEVAGGEVLYAEQASTRLRVLIPAAEIARHAQVLLVPLNRIFVGAAIDLADVAAVVVAKLPTGVVARFDADALAKLDEWLARAGKTTVLFCDLSDDYATLAQTFNVPVLAEYQRILLSRCVPVVPTGAFAAKLEARGAKRALVIEDPYEFESATPPRRHGGSKLRLCWFGNLGSPNAAFLMNQFGALAAQLRPQPAFLEMVAGAGAAATVDEIKSRAGAQNPGFEVGFKAWSLSSARDALDRSDFVLLPHQLDMPWAHVKSHNRLVESIRAGKLAIASPIPSYQELAAYAWLGDSLAEGIRWALGHPAEVEERVLAGQEYVRSRFAPATVGEKWAHALLAGGHAEKTVAPSA